MTRVLSNHPISARGGRPLAFSGGREPVPDLGRGVGFRGNPKLLSGLAAKRDGHILYKTGTPTPRPAWFFLLRCIHSSSS